MTCRGLIILIRNPEKGKVKTRIAAEAGEDRALGIYLNLLAITRQTALGLDCHRFLYATEHIADETWDSKDFIKRVQREGDLGERMFAAFSDVLTDCQKALIIGSDCPWLKADHLLQAFDALDSHDLVLGPASDGGYYLLGMKHPEASLFQGISWSSENVLQETIHAANQSGLKYFLLQTLSDVDHLDDWRAYEEGLRAQHQ
jgi:rSAM/selenodomain-associated transferase 1